jgi:hypothetical protein
MPTASKKAPYWGIDKKLSKMKLTFTGKCAWCMKNDASLIE